jgi:hypothetical protein
VRAQKGGHSISEPYRTNAPPLHLGDVDTNRSGMIGGFCPHSAKVAAFSKVAKTLEERWG